ncbi:DUF928 domain-containing protein [Pseudanabaena sp. UWO310]|uniref:DUF928 domain-containing protein n=1 Tax=Pseudanabaena sp. UWO310 TaxID=2480795 RepID=UPI00115A7B9B|nr:DUF928 domain-containing protein [Pseudanabaena sp. UWO310]TYQ31342.1 DUF928 domain-containing protein [Pseudanabaena sp. UWO310]
MITSYHQRFGSVVGIMTLLASSIGFSPSAAQSSTFSPPPENTVPTQTTGGASRGGFIPPADNSAPTQTTGGASRGTFVPSADSSAPTQTTGGASRGTFVPPATSSAPTQTTGGASRGTFVPPATSSAPTQTAGGASRSSFTPPPSSSAPIGTAGGASRTNAYGSYLIGDRPVFMAAVLPQTFYGTTLSAHPAILVYLPASAAQEAVFSLKDESKQTIYQMSVPVSGKAGIVAIQLPENAPALEVDKNYQWFFALKLEGNLTPNSPFVDGWIKRITPSADLAKSLEGKTSLQQSSILAANGVWYDSASILSSLRTAQPNDQLLAKEWKELLDSVQLSQLTSLAITK